MPLTCPEAAVESRPAAPGNTPPMRKKSNAQYCNRFAESAIGFVGIRLSVQKKALSDNA
jgi:hypothetical protein